MEYVLLLKQPRLAILWLSQVVSSLGDELYLIATMWMAVQCFGGNGMLVVAAMSVARIVFGLLGGVAADRLNRRSLMVVSDSIRFLATLTLAIAGFYGAVGFWHLLLVSTVIGTFGALFEPALQASLPALTSTPRSLLAMNALMELTRRLARAIAPSCAGLLVMVMPLRQFFTLDAFSFLISACAIVYLGSCAAWFSGTAKLKMSVGGVLSELREGFQVVIIHKASTWAILCAGSHELLWSCAFVAGVPFWVKHLPHADVGQYGMLVGWYGVGQVITTIVVGGMRIRRSILVINLACLIQGVGFLTMGCAHDPVMAMTGLAIASIGGPMRVLATLIMLQGELPAEHLGKILALRKVLVSTGMSLGLILAGPLYGHFAAGAIIAVCGFLIAATGAIGMWFFRAPKRSGGVPPVLRGFS